MQPISPQHQTHHTHTGKQSNPEKQTHIRPAPVSLHSAHIPTASNAPHSHREAVKPREANTHPSCSSLPAFSPYPHSIKRTTLTQGSSQAQRSKHTSVLLQSPCIQPISPQHQTHHTHTGKQSNPEKQTHIRPAPVSLHPAHIPTASNAPHSHREAVKPREANTHPSCSSLPASSPYPHSIKRTTLTQGSSQTQRSKHTSVLLQSPCIQPISPQHQTHHTHTGKQSNPEKQTHIRPAPVSLHSAHIPTASNAPHSHREAVKPREANTHPSCSSLPASSPYPHSIKRTTLTQVHTQTTFTHTPHLHTRTNAHTHTHTEQERYTGTI
ncbi:atrophin-1-like [Oncorhynchus mykiss]|uniref:atrophin-1-like n=1 Tax=Oncorhynchus mykiss TaxID=8022 RepID=UPI001877FE05|nr:atrophin-1-like [Oncorhynchus mykiss]